MWPSFICLVSALVSAALASHYAGLNGLLCMRSEFVETHSTAKSLVECAGLCDGRQSCQAFSMQDGPCQLFVFDRCSKYVRDCSCSRTAQVFVRQQPGLPPGALCPAGYGDDLCGTKYKFHSGDTDWDLFRQNANAESGLVIMADVVDNSEMTHLKSMFDSRNLTRVFLGGLRLSNGIDLKAGWLWIGCNSTIDDLWSMGEPNNGGGTECVTVGGSLYSKLIDGTRVEPSMSGSLSECVSPFN